MEELSKQTSLPTSKSSACGHYLQEWQKSLFTQFRALLSDFCHRYQLHSSELEIGNSLSQHMLRHAEWLVNRFQRQSRDNKTRFQRRWGIAYSNSALPFGELVLAPDLSLAIYLGRCESSDEHILAMANSSSLVKNNFVTRLSRDTSMELTLLKSISIPQPRLASAAYLKTAALSGPPASHQPQELHSTALPPPMGQRPLSATTALTEHVQNPSSIKTPP